MTDDLTGYQSHETLYRPHKRTGAEYDNVN